jgi:siroheme synthase-like protein
MRYYPVHLDLNRLSVLVVGGGVVAERRARVLVDVGAYVAMVSLDFTDGLKDMAERGIIKCRIGEFQENDLDGVAMVIGATDSDASNQAVAAAARSRNLLCNIVDRPALSNFITPALITRGELQISIATSGGSPSLTQRVKREVAAIIGEEYGELLEIAAELRAELHRHTNDYEERRSLLRDFVESDALDLLRSGHREEAVKLAHDILSRFLTEQ